MSKLVKAQPEKKLAVPQKNIKKNRTHDLKSQVWAPARKHIDSLIKSHKAESKSGYLLASDEFKSAMAAASSIFVNPNVTYVFRLITFGTFTTAIGASYFNYITFDPSAISEYASYMINLFNEVRIRRARVTLCPLATATTTCAFAISSDQGLTSTVPGALLSVLDNPNSRVISSNANQGRIQSMDVSLPGDILFSPTAAPCPGAGQGCYGEFQIGQFDNANIAEKVFAYLFEGWYEFRSRS